MATLGETPITKDDLEKIFQNYFNTKAIKLINVQSTIIAKGIGFLSDIMRIDLTWNDAKDLPTTVVVKAPKIARLRETAENMGVSNVEGNFIANAHNAECKAYKLLQHDRPIAVPIIYDCWPVTDVHAGLIVMEDMSEKAGMIPNIANGVTLNQWRNAYASLADLHAWSLTTTKPWREQLPTMKDIKGTVYKDFIAMASFGCEQIKDKYPSHFGDLNETELKKALDMDKLLQNQAKFRTKFDDVMNHGDSWTNNIMFSKNSDSTLSDTIAAFVDWQIAVKGCGVNDLARFETLCVNHEMRRTHSRQMLRFYYDRMIAKAGSKIKATFEEFENAYKESFIFFGMMFVGVTDVMLTSIVKADEDETGWRRNEMLERVRAIYDDAIKLRC